MLLNVEPKRSNENEKNKKNEHENVKSIDSTIDTNYAKLFGMNEINDNEELKGYEYNVRSDGKYDCKHSCKDKTK